MMDTLSCFFMYLPHDKSWKAPMLKMKTLNPIPNFNSSLSLKCHCSTTSPHLNQFAVSYLVTNFGFSLETATKVSKSGRFTTSERPDAVIAIFTNLGFSDSQISYVVSKAPGILACKCPHKRILSKLEFLLSKGASKSEVVEIVSRSPGILNASLDNCIIPTFELALDTVKEMGFNDPSHVNFSKALLAKRSLSESRWNVKVIVFKRWGWSDEMILEMFRKRPESMLSSEEKINKVMRFCVNELGWHSSALVKRAIIFSFSLEKRVIPRACVVSYLISNGLIDKNVESFTPFAVSEKKFLEKYVQCFKEERHNLLKLYQEKMDGKKIEENG